LHCVRAAFCRTRSEQYFVIVNRFSALYRSIVMTF